MTRRATDSGTIAGHDAKGIPGCLVSMAEGTHNAGRLAVSMLVLTVASGGIGSDPGMRQTYYPPGLS
jgi:hypothetical protein